MDAKSYDDLYYENARLIRDVLELKAQLSRVEREVLSTCEQSDLNVFWGSEHVSVVPVAHIRRAIVKARHPYDL